MIGTATANDGVAGAVTDYHAASGTVKVEDCVYVGGDGGVRGARCERRERRACGRDCDHGFALGIWTGDGMRRLCGSGNGGEDVSARGA